MLDNEEYTPPSPLTASELAEMKRSCDMAEYAGPDRIISAQELRESLDKQATKTFLYPTGLWPLDNAVGGIQTGELIAVGGPTKHGKTLFAQTITENMSKSGAKILWFTFEVPVPQFLNQIPASVEFFLPKKLDPYNLMWFEDRIVEANLKYGCRIVFVDNLHHLFDMAASRNVSLDIGLVIRSLKRMAVSQNIAIVILVHSRKPTDRAGAIQEPCEWDIRDSSFIPQESDSTWMVQRKMDKDTKEFTERALLKVCNHRRTGVMGKNIHLIKTGKLLEVDVTKYSSVTERPSPGRPPEDEFDVPF